MDEGVGGLDDDEEAPAQFLVRCTVQVEGQQAGEAVGDTLVGFGPPGAGGDPVAEVDQGEAGRGALHVQVLVEHGAHGPPLPRGAGGHLQAVGDLPREVLQVAPGRRVDHLALVAEEAVDRADGHTGALRDGAGAQGVVADLAEERDAGVQDSGRPFGAAALRRCTDTRRREAAGARARVSSCPSVPVG